jgi:hypothetical protein
MSKTFLSIRKEAVTARRKAFPGPDFLSSETDHMNIIEVVFEVR